MKRYLLVEFDPDEMPDKMCPEGLVTAIYHVGVRAAEVTDLFDNEALVHAMWVLRDLLERLQ